MGEQLDRPHLPGAVAKSVGKVVYTHGSPKTLHADDLLSVTGLLFSYYPPGNEEKRAALTLREWVAARDLTNRTIGKVQELHRTVERGVEAWEHEMRNHRYSEGRWGHSERRPEFLRKELQQRAASGDLDGLLDLVASMSFPQPPNVTLPPELVSVSKELAAQQHEYLAPFLVGVAAAEQCLSEYVFAVVAREQIAPE